MRSRNTAAALVAAVCLACGGGRKAPAAAPEPVVEKEAPAPERAAGRLVILGFDGVDPDWLDRWIAEGKLPTLAKLTKAHDGKAYRRLRSTNPPQSPVAWTSFATGTHPGDHGIFDFIARGLNPGEGLPVLPKIATTSFEVVASGPPVARNLRTGRPFWQLLGNAGVRVVAINVPYSFPPDPMRTGSMLSGLGVPDLRETNSTFTYAGTDVTKEEAEDPPGGGALVQLELADGRGSFALEGLTIPGGDGKRMALPVEVEKTATGTVTVGIAGKKVQLEPEKLSDWIEVEFVEGEHRVAGILRLAQLGTGTDTGVFVTPVSFHPRKPYSPISYPKDFSGTLADELGRFYKTVGWEHDTSALNAEVIDEALFLADVESIEIDRRELLRKRLASKDWELLIWVSVAPDRVSHMFQRLTDPDHPRYDAKLAAKYGDAIEKEYRRMDATVAEVLPALGADDTLIILSDHGFHGYRRGLHVNQWLRREGLLVLRGGAESSTREFLLDVDWKATKAYALGTGQIYLNRKGRERDGFVSEGEAGAIAEQIKKGLLALTDADRGGARVVRQVYVGTETFPGGRAADAPDLQIAFEEHYRTSWESILGGIPPELFADNMKKWSGDHAASDVEDTHGILITNKPVAREAPAIVDLAPTVLAHFGQDRPAQYAGTPLFEPAQ